MAHTNSPPVDVVAPIPGSVEENRAGYGWLNASSEVEADSLFRQECPRPTASGSMTFCIPRNSSLDAAYSLAGNNFEAAFTNLALDNAYEQMILQRAAVSPASNTWNLPSCIASSPRAQQMKTDIEAIKGMTVAQTNAHIRTLADQIKAITNINEASRTAEQKRNLEDLKRRHLMAIKLRATRQSFDSNRMAQAFLLDKQLGEAQKRECPPAVGIPRKCMSIRRNRDRMRLAFPSVFAGGLRESESFNNDTDRTFWEQKTFAANLEGLERCGTTPYTRFESSIYKLMGYNGAANPIPGAGTGPGSGSGSGCAVSDQDAAAIEQGKKTVDAAFTGDQGYPLIVTANDANRDGNADGAYTFAHMTGRSATAATNPRMANAFSALSQAATDMKNVQEMNAAVSMTTFCQDRRNLADIARLQPQAVRQAVLDQNNDRSREALTRLMCQKGIMSQFQADDQTLDCAPGVTGDPASSEGMKVKRVNYGFPFQSSSNYTIKTLPNGTLEVATKINYVFNFDPSISPGSPGYLGNAAVPEANRKTRAQQEAEFNANTTAWTQKSTAFLNSAAGAVADPKVTFKIEKCIGCTNTTPPVVNVSECYYRVMPSSFPTDFPGSAWDPHRCWYKMQGGVPTRMYGDWQDAGGFTTAMNDHTIMHETGHNLGLADEYVADYYPAHPVGEDGATGCNNSTMAGNTAACNVLYRRHLLEMVRPARVCPRP
ncbi:MAG: hypothetical protein HYV97_05500 [Bdellovibrio sp.]|nr:hypothetical protein [Bdellovibrio sp.]